MIRDCWIEQPPEHPETVLCIRQIKFDDNGSSPEAKIIRLVGDEITTLLNVINTKK